MRSDDAYYQSGCITLHCCAERDGWIYGMVLDDTDYTHNMHSGSTDKGVYGVQTRGRDLDFSLHLRLRVALFSLDSAVDTWT